MNDTQVLLVRLRQLISIVGLSRSTIYRLVKAGNFPKPIRIGISSLAWRMDEIHEWIDSRNRILK
jgi:prophage regulatory protein